MNDKRTEQRICAAICQSNGIKAKEIAHSLRLDRSTVNRVLYYADVLVITENRVFSLEFKMKDKAEPEEILQAAKYIRLTLKSFSARRMKSFRR